MLVEDEYKFVTQDGNPTGEPVFVGEGILARDIVFIKYPFKLAMALGNGEMAAIVSHLDYWVGRNTGDVGFLKDGHIWARAELDDIKKSLPWLSERTIKRYLSALLAGNWIQKAYLMHGIRHRVAFYRPNYAKLEELGIASQGRLISVFKNDEAKMARNYGAKLAPPREIGLSENESLKNIVPRPSDDGLELAKHLRERIVANFDGSASISKLSGIDLENRLCAWGRKIDRLMRLDKRSVADVRSVIDFAHDDNIPRKGFCWARQVLSPENLRNEHLWIQFRQARPTTASAIPAFGTLERIAYEEKIRKEVEGRSE